MRCGEGCWRVVKLVHEAGVRYVPNPVVGKGEGHPWTFFVFRGG